MRVSQHPQTALSQFVDKWRTNSQRFSHSEIAGVGEPKSTISDWRITEWHG